MHLDKTSGYLTFLRQLLIFSVVLGILATCIAFLVPPRFITPALPFLFLFFIAITLSGYYLLLRSVKSKFIQFVNTYLLITAIKLLLFVGIIFFYLLNNRQDAAAFGISFFILYLCYTIFEVVHLVSYFR